jgi:signal transduction histidine kinase
MSGRRRRPWRLGIWPQLLLAPIVGIALAFGALGYGAHRALYQAAAASAQNAFHRQAAVVAGGLQSAYVEFGTAALQQVAQEATAVYGAVVILRDGAGQVVARSAPPNAPANCQGWLTRSFLLGPGAVLLHGEYCAPNTAHQVVALGDRNLLRSLAVPAILGFLAALALAFLLNRRIGLAITALARATRRFAAGDLRARVPLLGPAEIADLSEDFNQMAAKVEEGEEQRRNLVADVAHELRTPLTVLRGYLEALKDGVAEPEPALLATIHGEAVQLERLVDDLQELAQAEAAELGLEPGRVELDALLPAVAAGFALSAQDKGVAIGVDAPHDLPPAWADSERIAQVLRNLVANALRYTPAGGTITMRAFRTGERLRTEVRDTGIGIPPEHRPHIFERFYRVDPSRARETGGSGLGLTIAKRIVEAHGGQIGLEENPGGGCCFWFTLPLPAE